MDLERSTFAGFQASQDKGEWLDVALPECPSFMPSARELDQFYTHPAVAAQCHARLCEVLTSRGVAVKNAFWLEPSAGAGAFYLQMPAATRHGVDLEPVHGVPGVVQGDFMEFLPLDTWLAEPARPVITEGNPPFGKNSSLAIKFFNQAARFSQVIAFVVPMTFRKESVHARLDTRFMLVHDEVLAPNSFVFEGRPYDVPCCFQIWVRSDDERRPVKTAPLEHPDFSFVTRVDASLAFRRVGGLAGRFFTEFEAYADASHYFLKPRGSLRAFTEVLAAIDWSSVKQNNAGNPSISKRELVREYEAAKQRLSAARA
jgi:hypothetical protein